MADTDAPGAHDDTRMIRERRGGDPDLPPMSRAPVNRPTATPAAGSPPADGGAALRTVRTPAAPYIPAHAAARPPAAAPSPAPTGAPAPARQAAPAGAPGPATPAAAPVWALALSGGGIRSATQSLGVLQAIAATHASATRVVGGQAPATTGTAPEGGAASATHTGTASPAAPPPPASPAPAPAASAPAASAPAASAPAAPVNEPAPAPAVPISEPASYAESLLSRFDYLSTVSGGGYTGGFLCSLFLPDRLRAHATVDQAADDVVKALVHEPPGRMRANEAFNEGNLVEAPLRWLRDNGRYLSPTGGGDLFYAVALALRNWLAIHYVIGTVLVMLFAMMAAVTAWWPWLHDADMVHLQQAAYALSGPSPGWLDGLWYSPWFLPAGLVFVFWAVPAGLSYWIPRPAPDDGRCDPLPPAFWGYIGVIVLLLAAASWHAWMWPPQGPDGGDLLTLGGVLQQERLWLVVCGIVVIALGQYVLLRFVVDGDVAEVETLRVALTRWLRDGLLVAGALLLLGVVDTAARTAYLAISSGEGRLAHVLTPAGLAGGIVWGVRRFALSSDDQGRPSWLKKLPWTWIAGGAGIVVMSVLATAWSLAVVALQWQGQRPDAPADPGQRWLLLAIWVVALLLSVVVGRFPSFINLSSLQSFYGSRLTRAYLGASNGLRFSDAGRRASWSVAEPHEGDAVSMSAFVKPAPDGSDLPATLATRAPLHLINVTMNDTVDPGEQLVQRDRKGKPVCITPLGFSVDGGPTTPFANQRADVELQRPLGLGQWIGTSGAAFSTGIGRETTLGLSLLMGAANVRLGTWWESGIGDGRGGSWLSRTAEAWFRTQSYLYGEFTAQFHGLKRRWQYLSDGGHFENTAVYELLRPTRDVRFIIACDHGADPAYRFSDLANLVRLARIDLQVEVVVDDGVKDVPLLRPWFGVPADFRPPQGAAEDIALGRPAQAPNPRPSAADPPHEPVALLLRASHGQPSQVHCWIVMLKPRVRTDSAPDVVQYALSHPTFPQEPTADQFYDEAQWESYRKLGRDNAAHLLQPQVWAALHAYIN